MEPVVLRETKHPHREMQSRYDSLIGLEEQKNQLLHHLTLILDKKALDNWHQKHHQGKLNLLKNALRATPLILLAGDVGCGKTELAACIGSPLSKALGDKTIRVFETPSDIRGGGLVGELSARITAAFRQVSSRMKPQDYGVLIIDEADDMATDRDQQQAHHEDRAGVNALIKKLDKLEKEKASVAVLFITNRVRVMDPAILRRASAEVHFSRSKQFGVREVLEHLLGDVQVESERLKQLTETCLSKQPLYSYADFFTRIIRQAFLLARQKDIPYSVDVLEEAIEKVNPSPQIL